MFRAGLFHNHRPEWRGKDHDFNAISRLYNVTRDTLTFDGTDITNVKAESIASLGIARTFQNIELFENASVLQNLLIGRATHSTSRFGKTCCSSQA